MVEDYNDKEAWIGVLGKFIFVVWLALILGKGMVKSSVMIDDALENVYMW